MDWYKISGQIVGNVLGIVLGMLLIKNYGVLGGLIGAMGALMVTIVVLHFVGKRDKNDKHR